MLIPMGLPKDVSVIAWGLSLERYIFVNDTKALSTSSLVSLSLVSIAKRLYDWEGNLCMLYLRHSQVDLRSQVHGVISFLFDLPSS